MDVEAHPNLQNEQTNDCRSLGSNIDPSIQSRKISIGVMADSNATTRSGAVKGDGAVLPNTERVISNVGNSVGEKNKVEGVTASPNINQIGGPEEVKRYWVSKSFCQRTPTPETILQANQASSLLVTPGGRVNPDGILCAPAKISVQPFSKQTSAFPSSEYNQEKFNGYASKRKGRKDGTCERVEEFTFTTPQEVFHSDKTKPKAKINKTENGTENLRRKLWQILGTTSSPKTQHSGSHTCNIDVESLPLEQHLNQKDDKFVEIRQNSDTIETDSENPEHTNKRPVTRSRTRKKASAKKQPAKGKSGPTSKETENHRAKGIFSFEEKWTARQDSFLNDDCSKSLRKKSQGKNSRIGPHKISFPENDTTDKLHQNTSKADLPPHDGATFSLASKTGGLIGCLPVHQTKCLQTEETNQEREHYHSPTVNHADQHGELEGSENENRRECRSSPVLQNVAKSLDNFESPTLQLDTPTLTSFPGSMPKTDQKENDVSSPASTERRLSFGTLRDVRTFQTLKRDFNRLRAQKQSSDIEELKYSIPRKAASLVKEKEEQDAISDSSSEERSFQGTQEGSKVRLNAERKSFMLHPIKRLCWHEGIKFNDSSPASLSSKGIGDNDWIHEASEQNQDGSVRAVELFALELGKLKNKLKSVASQKSSEILKSVAEEIHLQLQNVHSQIQTDIGKLTNFSKSKRKRLETRFEDRQKQLRLIYNKFTEEVRLHLQDCRNTVEGLEADQMEIKGALEKQREAHRKLLSQVEEAVEVQLNDAQRKITATQEMARGKLLQLKHVITMCLKEGILN